MRPLRRRMLVRTRRKDDAAVTTQDMGDFARAPGGMVIARGEDTGFLRLRSTLGAVLRTAGAVVHIVAVEPFVDGFTADAEAAGKFADVDARFASEDNGFCTLFFHGEGSPRHGFSVGWDGVSVTHVSTCVTHVSGPYKLGGGIVLCFLNTFLSARWVDTAI